MSEIDVTGKTLDDNRLREIRNLLRSESSISFHSQRAAESMWLLVAEVGRLRNERGPIPTGLDARPVVRFTVHCSHCGKASPGYEFDDTCLWALDELSKLGGYHLDERDWKTNDGLHDPEFEGRAVVCPECWAAGWCEHCDSEIHAWQPFESARAGYRWHVACNPESTSDSAS